jgi:hypothetical protein
MHNRVFTKTVLPSKLKKELDSVVPGIVDHIFVISGSEVHVVLNSEPTGQQDTQITETVNSHVPSIIGYKIWNFVLESPSKWSSPLDLDYKKGLTVRLHPKNTFVKGELTKKEFYETASVNIDGSINFSNLILKEENVFHRDLAGFAVCRQKTITWILENEQDGPDVKTTMKYYDGVDKMQEGVRRRGNLIDALIMEIAGMLIYFKTAQRIAETSDPSYQLTSIELDTEIQKGRDLLTHYASGFGAFVSHSDKQIVTDLANDVSFSFLNENVPNQTPVITIRDYIIDGMSI